MGESPIPDMLISQKSDQEGTNMKRLLELLAQYMAFRGFNIP